MVTVYTGKLPLGLARATSELPHKMYLYLEYTNSSGSVPSGYTTAAAIPNFSTPIDYYNGLQNSNFLRVPAIKDPNIASTEVSDASATATITFFGQSTATTTGVLSNSVPFGNNSICYGAALVLVLDEADRTKDIILARAYFVGSTEYLSKTSSSQVFVTFPFTVSVTKQT